MPIDKYLQKIKADRSLTKLNLCGNDLTGSDIQMLIEAMNQNQTLTSLDVSYNKIGDEGAKALSQNQTLTSLDVSSNQIGDEGAKALSQNQTLTSLDVSSNQIGDEGAKALGQNQTLTSLIVSFNKIGDEGAKALNQNKTLTTLNVSYNKIGEEGAKALSQNKTLTRLNIFDNKIGDEGAKALSQNQTLTSLIVSFNKIGDEGAKALSQNKILTMLHVDGNRISDIILEQIEQRLAANKKRQIERRNAFIFRLNQGLVKLGKLAEAQQLPLPRELIAHIGSFLDARFYLQLVNINHPAHIAKTAQQVYSCALFLLMQQPNMVKENNIVERKANPPNNGKQTFYQSFMFKPIVRAKLEQPATKEQVSVARLSHSFT